MRVISLLIIVFLIQCSNNFAGGTSSTDNPKVMGYIVDKDSLPVSNAEVMIIPITYNPLIDDLSLSGDIDTTDINGRFELLVPDTGTFNIQSTDIESNRNLLLRNIKVELDEEILDTMLLTDPGALKIILPKLIDTNNSFIFVKGTLISKKLSDLKMDSINNNSIIINNLPTGNIPEIIYWKKVSDSSEILIPDTIEINSNDTTVINLDSIPKPAWNFPCVIAVTQQSADNFGGLDNISDSILNQFKAVNNTFNEMDLFDGYFNFSADSFYIIAGEVDSHAIMPPEGFALRVIYDGLKEGSLVANSFNGQWVYHSYGISDEGGMFGVKSQNFLNWLLGLMRGAKPLDDVEVLAENNPFNNQGFKPMESIMSNPTDSGPWDSYNVNLLNYYKDDFTIIDVKHSAFPSSIGVYVESSIGVPVENAEIKLYGVTIDQGTIDSNNVLLTGNTSNNGEFEFQKNPYLNDALDRFMYDNILISVSINNSTTLTWMPFYEPSNAWFEDSSIIFRKKIVVP